MPLRAAHLNSQHMAAEAAARCRVDRPRQQLVSLQLSAQRPFGSEYQAIEFQELSPQNSLMWYSLSESLWTWIEVAQLDTSSADAIEVMNTQRLVFAFFSL